MLAGELGQPLHDKATRGAPLTPPEQAQLEAWFQREDSAESQILLRRPPETTPSALRAQVDQALAEMTSVARNIQELAAANELLRRDLAALRERVAQLPAPQAA